MVALAWLLCFAAWALLSLGMPKHHQALFGATALALLALPLVNLLTTHQSHLLATLPRGDWALAAVDLTALALAAGFGWLALRGRLRAAATVLQPQMEAR